MNKHTDGFFFKYQLQTKIPQSLKENKVKWRKNMTYKFKRKNKRNQIWEAVISTWEIKRTFPQKGILQSRVIWENVISDLAR